MQRSASTGGLRRALWLAGLALFATAVAAVIAFAAPAPDVPVVDLTGEVTQESCSPCHARLDEAATPGLVFSHGTHILFACASCHLSMPHEAGRTERPAMATCFTCHGVPHTAGPALASGQCSTCHTPQFRLKPRTHAEDWSAEPHARATVADGVNQCMLCHYAPRDCDACHTELALDVPAMPAAYIASVPQPPDRAPVRVALGGPVTPSQCVYCHYDIDDFAPGRIIFYHDDHLPIGVGCRACHAVFPHSAQGTVRNTMADCYRCHSLVHSERGLVATEECGACHPPAFELVPANHTAEFAAREHPVMVEEDETYCTLCHKSPFCQECHRAGRTMADGSPARFVIPENHVEVAWLSEHGRQFLDATGTCWACHDSPSCERCHQTPTPHPTPWLTMHGESEFSTRPDNDCSICHTDRTWCQDCHHEQVRHVYLVEENCVECHEEMATRPRTQLRDRKLAPHAVHFEVEEVKGRPYRCYECHVTWGAPVANGAAREHVGSPVELGHDLRICYDCHGALDFRRVLIAPWPGAQLCGRCHEEGPVAELGGPAARR